MMVSLRDTFSLAPYSVLSLGSTMDKNGQVHQGRGTGPKNMAVPIERGNCQRTRKEDRHQNRESIRLNSCVARDNKRYYSQDRECRTPWFRYIQGPANSCKEI